MVVGTSVEENAEHSVTIFKQEKSNDFQKNTVTSDSIYRIKKFVTKEQNNDALMLMI